MVPLHENSLVKRTANTPLTAKFNRHGSHIKTTKKFCYGDTFLAATVKTQWLCCLISIPDNQKGLTGASGAGNYIMSLQAKNQRGHNNS